MATSAANGSAGSLIAEARAGSPDALSALYLEHGVALFRLAYRLVGAREDAEDVVHDVFVGLPEALGRYEERGSFGAWLKRVIARVALMTLRSGKRRREVGLDCRSIDRGEEVCTRWALWDRIPVRPGSHRSTFG
jgi:DNA-directed RNA polymerase specialized sigma24 family protein